MTNTKTTLRDIYEVVNRLEDKMDKRLCADEERIEKIEGKLDTLTGRITAGVALLSVFFNAAWDWFKAKL